MILIKIHIKFNKFIEFYANTGYNVCKALFNFVLLV